MAKQVAELRAHFKQEQQQAVLAYDASQGKPKEERGRIFEEKRPKSSLYAQQALTLAAENPKDPASLEALNFVVKITSGSASAEDARLLAEAIDQLSRDHLDTPEITPIFRLLTFNPSDPGDKLMRLAAEKSKNRDVRGMAMFRLAQSLRNESIWKNDEKKLAEAKKLYHQIETEYADVKSRRLNLGDLASANLFELEKLAVGKTAPEIEGKNQDDQPMKLSDYRGKVVVLDFWGDW